MDELNRPDVLRLSRRFGFISDSFVNLKMDENVSLQDVPPSVRDVLRIFLAASTRGEHVTLVLESKMMNLTSKYRCVERVTGPPGTPKSSSNQKKKNPSQLRRSKLRQEAFFRRKQREVTLSGNQKLAKQKIVQLEGQQAGAAVCQEADGIPQLDGDADEVDVTYTFISNYGDEDIRDSLEELKEANLVPESTALVSRVMVEPLSAHHLCTVALKLPVGEKDFSWPELPDYPDFFTDVQKM